MTETCGRPLCAGQYRLEQRKRDLVERLRGDMSQAIAERERQAAACPSDATDTWAAIVTPANTRKLKLLPRRRKYRFAKRLLKLINGVAASGGLDRFDTDQASVAPASELSIVGTACSNCRGHCCSRGGTSAFIDERLIKRFVLRRPTSPLIDMLRLYCSYLPMKTYEGSCVFHSATGCSLPRDLRSNTCNNTICGGVAELEARASLDGQRQFFLAALSKQGVERSQFAEL